MAHMAPEHMAGVGASRPVWIAVLAGVPAIALVVAYVIWALSSGRALSTSLTVASVGFAYAIAGTVGWWRHPQYRTGPLMVAAAYLTLLGTLQRLTDSGVLYAIGNTLGGQQVTIFGYLLITFPSGRASNTPLGWLARLVLVVPPALALGDLLTRDTNHPCINIFGFCTNQRNPFMVIDLGSVFSTLLDVAAPLLSVAVLGAVLWRFVQARGAARRALAPVLVAGAIAALVVAIQGVMSLTVENELASAISNVAEVLIPIALGVGFIRSRMAGAAVGELLVKVGGHPAPRDLEAAIRAALHDPTARLLRWAPGTAAYYRVDGNPATIQPSDDRELTEIFGGDRLLGVIEHDPVLNEEGDLKRSVAAATRIVLENELLSTSLQAQVADVARLPSGVVTMMRTDIEGSTELLAHLRERYATLLLELRQLLRGATQHGGGVEIDSRADEFFAAFPSAGNAVGTAIEIQRQIAARDWPDNSRVRLRIGLHTGRPELTSEGYVGMDVHLTARVSATGNGGQIVISDALRGAIGEEVDTFEIHDLGSYRLKGIPRTVSLFQVDIPGSPNAFAPLRAELIEAARS